VGTYAVQLAKQVFDAHVTGVCSTRNLEMVKSLGAEEVIDYTQEDFLKQDETYDLIFDAVGKLSSSGAKAKLKESGTFLSVRTPTRETLENLSILKELFDAGKLKPVIDRMFSLEEAADAHRYVETGRKRGNVVITVVSSESGGR